MKMRQVIEIIVVINLIIMGWMFVFMPTPVNSANVNEFSNIGTTTERTVTLTGNSAPYMDATTYFEIPINKGQISSASMKISSESYNDEYPVNPYVDFGLDGNVDWEFSGDGFGDFGYQTQFNNSATETYISVSGVNWNKNTGIRLPKNAHVLSASLTLDGEGGGQTISGSVPESGNQYAGSFNDEYSFFNIPINYIKFNCYSSDSDTYHIDVNGYIPGLGWEQIYYYHDFSNPGAKQYNYNPTKYTKWNIYYYDYENNDWISYTYEYNVGGTATNPKLDIGDNGNIDWSYPDDFDTVDSIPNFSIELNTLLQSSTLQVIEDEYGNQYVDIPLNLSTTSNGGIMVKNLEIEYEITAVIDKKPDNRNLAMELNAIVPKHYEVAEIEDKHKVYIGLYSDNPSKLKISYLDIEYNGAPVCTDIPNDYSINEDSFNEYLINLTHYFSDDYQDSIFLDYKVESYTNPEYVEVDIYDRYFMGVNAEREPNTNWHGTCDIVVSAEDSEGIKDNSNQFSVTIAEVNDDPQVWLTIPNKNLTANTTNFDIDLDAKIKVGTVEGYYFTDMDSEILYYNALVAPYAQDILAAQVEVGNILNLTAIGEYRLHIPVRIFCDDDQLVITKLTDYNSDVLYQEIIVNITSPGGSTPPMWNYIPDAEIPEGSTSKNWLNLRNYVVDLDDSLDNLTFSIVTVSNSAFITININPDGSLDLLPSPEFDGVSIVTLKVEDDEHNSDTTKFTISMIPLNDVPTVKILSHSERETVSGNIKLQGSAYDIEFTLKKVELKFGEESGDWIMADGLTYWNYVWDTMEYAPSSPKLVKVFARAYDGMNYSEVDIVELIINNVNIDVDGDGVPNYEDMFPNDPSDWTDTDNDGYGDNSDAFPNNASEWLDNDGDGYGGNSDEFPHDATEWRDTDGDGYGDNSDAYPNDPDRHLSSTAAGEGEKSTEVDIADYLWFFTAVIIVINIIILISYISIRRKEKKLTTKNQ